MIDRLCYCTSRGPWPSTVGGPCTGSARCKPCTVAPGDHGAGTSMWKSMGFSWRCWKMIQDVGSSGRSQVFFSISGWNMLKLPTGPLVDHFWTGNFGCFVIFLSVCARANDSTWSLMSFHVRLSGRHCWKKEAKIRSPISPMGLTLWPKASPSQWMVRSVWVAD